ncbi:hypothetical protein ACOME3_006894 [Neoechinorhynchus agilis]
MNAQVQHEIGLKAIQIKTIIHAVTKSMLTYGLNSEKRQHVRQRWKKKLSEISEKVYKEKELESHATEEKAVKIVEDISQMDEFSDVSGSDSLNSQDDINEDEMDFYKSSCQIIAKAKHITFIRYKLTLQIEDVMLRIDNEDYILSSIRSDLRFE